MINILEKIELLKKCDLCQKNIATKKALTFANENMWICKDCYRITKF